MKAMKFSQMKRVSYRPVSSRTEFRTMLPNTNDRSSDTLGGAERTRFSKFEVEEDEMNLFDLCRKLEKKLLLLAGVDNDSENDVPIGLDSSLQ